MSGNLFAKKWNEKNDIVAVNCTPIFPVETAEKYEISAFCVTTANGIFYQKKYRGAYCIANVTEAGETIVFKKAFVSAANQEYTCMIVYDEESEENYLIDTRGEWYKLPRKEPTLFLGPAQYGFSLDKTTGYYKIMDRDVTLWRIKAISQEDILQYQAETAPDTSLTINNEFVKFFKKRPFFERDKYRYIYHTCGSNKQGRILAWLIKKGLPHEIVPNIFEDDDTINVRIQLNEKNIAREDVQYLLARFRGEYSIFGISLDMYVSVMDITLAQIHRYYSGLPSVSEAQEKMCCCVLNTMKMLLKVKNDSRIFANTFEKILSTAHFTDIFTHNCCYQQNPSSNIDLRGLQRKCTEEKERFLQYESALLAEMKESGVTISRWVGETDMFSLVHRWYPDAIYQYRANWLGKQSLDVYIPSLKIAFEYQGVQHFKPIEHFGGEEKFAELQERDHRKLQLCNKNRVKIIYWNYDEPVTERVLKHKLSLVGVGD